MKKVDFSTIDFNSEVIENKQPQSDVLTTSDNITLKNYYAKKDVDSTEHIGFVSGIAPNLRGPYSSMYTVRPWTIRQ
ncbi:MAG: methylmalonyl-CoA mutase family protein, partial [Crocinitomicaceae bacterium]|nr:methylmalonyl-CoA mutase family protein [Crocinitomicaceae bacterium]